MSGGSDHVMNGDRGMGGMDRPRHGQSAEHRIDSSVAHSARRYNYWLGGKDNFAADRVSGDQIEAAMPTIRLAAQENRRYLQRVVRFLTRQGINQYLDIGTGIPTAQNTHEVAQGIDARARVVYVDNDPIVLAHARALLTSTPEGATAYIDADLREPEKILGDPSLKVTLDFTQPVALMLIAVLHFIGEDEDPYASVRHLVQALPAGSYVAVSHVSYDLLDAATRARLQDQERRHGPFRGRSEHEISHFFDGLELVPPGLVPIVEWHPDQYPQPAAAATDVAVFGGVAHVPELRP
jgi:S-adenosyl methyltransferase